MFSDVSSDHINISLLQTLTHLPVGLFLFKSHAEISQFFTSPFMMYILKTSLRSQCWCSCVRKCAVFCSHSQLSACNSLVSQLFKAAAFFGCEIVIVCLLIAKAQTSRIRNRLVKSFCSPIYIYCTLKVLLQIGIYSIFGFLILGLCDLGCSNSYHSFYCQAYYQASVHLIAHMLPLNSHITHDLLLIISPWCDCIDF